MCETVECEKTKKLRKSIQKLEKELTNAKSKWGHYAVRGYELEKANEGLKKTVDSLAITVDADTREMGKLKKVIEDLTEDLAKADEHATFLVGQKNVLIGQRDANGDALVKAQEQNRRAWEMVKGKNQVIAELQDRMREIKVIANNGKPL